MNRGKNQCAARAVPPIAGSSRASALHLLRLLLPRVLLDHAQEAFLKHALVILALSSTLECCVAAPFLIEQNGCLVQALLEILLAVLQRFNAPLQKEVVLLQARCCCIRWRSFGVQRP